MDKGPDVNSCSSTCAISNSLHIKSVRTSAKMRFGGVIRELVTRL